MRSDLKPICALLAALLLCATTWSAVQKTGEGTMNVTQAPFGKTPDGKAVELYTLTNRNGVTAKIMTYGAILTSLEVPDRAGKLGQVVLGFDTLEEYLKGHPYFGATAGRYANRIAKGKFTLDGKEYTLAVNNGENHLHGGLKGFDKVVWQAEPLTEKKSVGVKFSYLSPDGEEGYPGNLKVSVTYSLNDKNELRLDYAATTDKTTVLNLTHHTYFNLAGPASGNVLNHEMKIKANQYLPVDKGSIPLGQPAAVKGTPMDFKAPHKIGERSAQVEGGYDHNWCLNGPAGTLSQAALVYEATSGREMKVSTTEPGIQFYTGNFLDGTVKARGVVCNKNQGFCLETQHYPDSPNQPQFPTTVLKPGETYTQVTVYRFSVRAEPK
jgi:aldose 1-epimerase